MLGEFASVPEFKDWLDGTYHGSAETLAVLFCRADPRKNAKEVTVWQPGQRLRVMCKLGDWLYVQAIDSAVTGWSHADYLRVVYDGDESIYTP